MATNIRWWKDGDSEHVAPYQARTRALELCTDCGAPFGIHGKVGSTLVHPGDHIITNNAGDVYVETPDPFKQS